MKKRYNQNGASNKAKSNPPKGFFDRKITCSVCGELCNRIQQNGEHYWSCSGACAVKSDITPVPESILINLGLQATGENDISKMMNIIREIRLFPTRRLVMMLIDKRNFAFTWQERIVQTAINIKPHEIKREHMDTAKYRSDEGRFGFCRNCGKDLQLTPSNQMKRFCSERCRQKWWRAHPGVITHMVSVSTCANCGVIFKNGGNQSRRFCSKECYFNYRCGR